MDDNFEEWLQNQRRSRQAELNDISVRNENAPSRAERKTFFQEMIDRVQQTTTQISSAVVDEFVNGSTSNLQEHGTEHLESNLGVEPTEEINVIDQELGQLIRSQRVSSLLNCPQFRRTLEERLQSSLVNVRSIQTTVFPRQGLGGAPEVNTSINVESLIDPNNDPELQALLNYQIVSNMLQSAFRTHLENTLWSRHISRERHNTVNEPLSTGYDRTSLTLTTNQNNLLHSMRNELTEMRSMMRILLQSQIETHRSIRQEVTSVLRSSTADSKLSLTNDLLSSCAICLNSTADTVIYRCGHLCVCYACSIQMRVNVAGGIMHCPICRTRIEDMIRIYGSSHNLSDL